MVPLAVPSYLVPFWSGMPLPLPVPPFPPSSLLPVFVLGPRRPHAPSLPHQGLVARMMKTREVKLS